MQADEINVGFDVFDLTGAAAAGEELSPLQFDREEYTPFEEFLQGLEQLPDKPCKVHNYALGVRGRVTRDRMETYLKHDGESSSLLKEALKSPRHYLFARNGEIEPTNRNHFDLGTFVHSALLEPEKFDKVHILPVASRAETQGLHTLIRYYRELLGEQVDLPLSDLKMSALREQVRLLEARAAEAGHSFVDATHAAIVNNIRITFKTYGGGILPRIMPYVKTETSMYGKDPSTGLKVKIRPDGLLLQENFGMNAILSVKTTSATSVEAFMRDCAKYRYELAEGMYLKVASEITGRPFTSTVMIMAQTVIPFQIAVFYWDAEDLEVGKYKYAQAMDIVKQCRDASHWPGFDAKAEAGAHGIIQCKLPGYIKQELLPQYLPEQ